MIFTASICIARLAMFLIRIFSTFISLEASLCPDVVVAEIDPKKLKRKQTVNVSVSK